MKSVCGSCGAEWEPAPIGVIHKCQCGTVLTQQSNPWAVVHGSRLHSAESYEIVASTEKTVTVMQFGRQARFGKDRVYAILPTKDQAWKLVSRIRGIRGEADRRINAADQWAKRMVEEAVRKEISNAAE